MDTTRRSGVFLHLTSLPGPHGIGDLGAGTRTFLDFLDRAEQTLWQICPLGPTTATHGHSPYAAASAFAGNPLLIDLREVADRGHLSEAELEPPAGVDPDAVNYDAVASFKRDRLQAAYERFTAAADDAARDALATFREREADWLAEYTLYAALKDAHDGAAWTDWPADLVAREADALAAARETHADRIAYHAFVQWLFDEQWRAFRDAATDRGIRLVGDLPLYVAADSADVWANQDVFQLAADGTPAVVAGVPPNPGDDGQRWGNPVYDWETLSATDYGWWMARLDRLLSHVDLARIDHFKGFDEYWAIPADADDPAAGEWRPAPGVDFFETAAASLGVDPTALPFVAEDLGFIDDAVVALCERFDLPGMRVPQYADWCTAGSRDKPMNYPRLSAGYTSTHDTDTAVGYYRDLDAEQRDCLHYALATDGTEINWDFIEAVWHSDAALAMTTVPDLHGLGSDARFNVPGTTDGNWAWRVRADDLTDEIADRLGDTTIAALR